MSKTDKTAPWTVKVFYEPSFLEEYHDHCEGPCDLPPKPRNRNDGNFQLWHGGKRADDETRCYWSASYHVFWRDPISYCPCWMCHGSYYGWGISTQRQDRYAAKRYCQDGWRDEY